MPYGGVPQEYHLIRVVLEGLQRCKMDLLGHKRMSSARF